MKKVRSTILILALTVTVAFSQTAPDFTVTDINEETHELYADYNQDLNGSTTIDFMDASANNQITTFNNLENLFEGLTVYPNPSNDMATIDFDLNDEADVKIQVLNMLGQKALNVFEGNKYPGSHQIEMNVANLQPGTYLIRVTANETVRTIRFAKSMR